MSDTLSTNTVYDKAKYHYEGDFPTDLPREQAYVFTGFFLGWIEDHDMYSVDAFNHYSRHIEDFKQRKLTSSQLYRQLGGVLATDLLNEEGNKFANYYYCNLRSGEYEFGLRTFADPVSPYNGGKHPLYHYSKAHLSGDGHFFCRPSLVGCSAETRIHWLDRTLSSLPEVALCFRHSTPLANF